MGKASLRKMKILHLRDMLLAETDDEHGLTMPQIIERLQEKEIAAERKALYDDLDVLSDFGLDIVVRRGPRTEYAVGERHFEMPELLLLIDAVQSSRFLTKQKSDALIEKLKKLASKHQADFLDKSMHVEGRIKTQNESIYYNVDTIQEAVQQRKKITFRYFEYGLDKKEVLRREGRHYFESPIDLIYKDEFYYLITYNDKHDDFVRYRVDRMIDIVKTDEPVAGSRKARSFNVQEFCARAFGMYGGDVVSVVLAADRSVLGSVIDRFGKEVLVFPGNDNAVKVHVSILKSTVFYGWLAQFGNMIKIEKPETLAREYQEHLQGVIEGYASG